MKQGDMVLTPRFLTVRINEVFESEKVANQEGYTEPTHFLNPEWDILGKHIGENRIIFAAVRI